MTTLKTPIILCEIGAAHGIRGELRVKAFTADPLAIGDYGPLYDAKGRRFEIRTLRHLKDDMLVVAFKGLTGRNEAEKLTRTELFVDRSALPEGDDEDEFYHADLIGLAAETAAGEALGTISAVVNFGADDLLDIRRPAGGSVLVPFTRAVVPVVDIAGGRVVIDPPDGLLDAPAPPPPEADVS